MTPNAPLTGRPFGGEGLARALLRLFPRPFREMHAEEFLQAAREERVKWRAGVAGDIGFWAYLLADFARGLARAWLGGLGIPRVPGGDLARDVIVSSRALRRTPGTSALIVVMLALGIGMTSATFSLVDAVLLSPLRHDGEARLMYLESQRRQDDVNDTGFAGAVFRDLRRESRTFADIAAFQTIRQNLTGVSDAEQVEVGWVSGNFFALLGTTPRLGRLIAEDDSPGTAVLSHGLWVSAFAGSDEAIGRSVSLDGYSYTIVGVLPPDFAFRAPGTSTEVAIWKNPDNWWQNGDAWFSEDRSASFLQLIGRLERDLTLDDANMEMAAMAARYRDLETTYASSGFEIVARPLLDTIVGDVRKPILLLLVAAGVVLLIACANVMNLLLVRAQGRMSEFGLRLALGSGRARLLRLMMAECFLLAAGGGAGGVFLAVLAGPVLRSAESVGMPRLEELAVDARIVTFAATVSVVCTLAAGLAPAVWASRRRAGVDLGGVRSTTGRGRARVTNALVVLQIALSLVLLIGAGLLGASLIRTQQVDPGFDAARLATFAISLPGAKYDWPEGTNRFLRRYEDALEALPGVESAAVVWPLPLGSGNWVGRYVGGEATEVDRVAARQHLVTPDYFETVGTPLVEGRGFGTDNPKDVVIVSRALAERAWPGESAVGKQIEASPWGPEKFFAVIGVAENVRFTDLRSAPEQVIYVDAAGWSWADWEVDVLVRSSGDPLSVVPAARAALRDLDADIPLARPRAMEAYVADQMAPNRLALQLVGLFAAAAALLAAIGLYGVLSHMVAMRSKEIGIRVALGCAERRVMRLVLGRGLRLTLLGVAIGVVVAGQASGLLGAYLFEVEPTNVTLFATVAAGFTAVATIACAVPARRAARVNPISVIRGD